MSVTASPRHPRKAGSGPSQQLPQQHSRTDALGDQVAIGRDVPGVVSGDSVAEGS